MRAYENMVAVRDGDGEQMTDPEEYAGVKTAFITGAASGIGRATAELFASHGSRTRTRCSRRTRSCTSR